MDDFTITLPTSIDYHSPSDLIFIDKNSAYDLRRKLQTFAYYFKRELKFDFIQYQASEHLEGPGTYRGFLFTSFAYDLLEEDEPTPYRLYGGGLFRWQEREDSEPNWELDWIWLHPFFRHRGILTKNWPILLREFGKFDIARPLSADMERFLSRAT